MSRKQQEHAVTQTRLLSSAPSINSVFLPAPDRARHAAEFEGPNLRCGISCMQGWRATMEDAHCINLQLDRDVALFAVFDGHGGQLTALICAERLAGWIKRSPHFAAHRYDEALRDAFIGGDKELRQVQTKEPSGTTAVASIVTPTHIYTANVGDSRAVLTRNYHGIDLSRDHKPILREEQERVVRNGGHVLNGRVNGMLAMTRSLGDFMFKDPNAAPGDQVVTPVPEISTVQRNSEDQFLIIACDGIWDCLSSQEVSDFFVEEMQEHDDLALMCENLCEVICAPTIHSFGTDNMTVMVVMFKDNIPQLPMPKPSRSQQSPTHSSGNLHRQNSSQGGRHPGHDRQNTARFGANQQQRRASPLSESPMSTESHLSMRSSQSAHSHETAAEDAVADEAQ